MNRAKTLTDILPPPKQSNRTAQLRWRATVPLATNPFLCLDLFLFALLSAASVMIILLSGLWFTEGSVQPADARVSFDFAALVFGGCIGIFLLIAIVFFGNRYFAVYAMDDQGIYYENSRGNDERSGSFRPRMRPYPVIGSVRATRTKGKQLDWNKADNFQNFPSMRVIQVKKGRWHMLRLYTPDEATHELVVNRLKLHLPQS